MCDQEKNTCENCLSDILEVIIKLQRRGQKFDDRALAKIAWLAKMKEEMGYHYLIEVDGGINEETGKLCKDAGVDVLVAGSYIFGSDNYQEKIDSLR